MVRRMSLLTPFRASPIYKTYHVGVFVKGPLGPAWVGRLVEAIHEEHAADIFREEISEDGFELLSDLQMYLHP